jgi:hypothetical protein
VKRKLAAPNWGDIPYLKDSYSRVFAAMEIDETAALMSASWGLGQIMGYNYKQAGYKSVQGMVAAFCYSEAAHLEGMINFIINNGLDDELRRHDWAGFAKGYNGTGYRKNQYDIRLAKRYEHWRKIKDTPYDPKDLKWSSEDAIKETLQNGQQEEIDIVKDVKSSEASVVKAPETIQVPTEIGKPSPSFIAWLVNLFKKAPKT